MVSLIAGKKGSGKTKDIVSKANQALETTKGSMIFIDDDNRAMYDLHHDIRFINLSEFPIKNTCEFLGFICGLVSNNYDIEAIYIDGILNSVKASDEELVEWLKRIEDVSTAYDIHFIVTLNHEMPLPETLKKYVQ